MIIKKLLIALALILFISNNGECKVLKLGRSSADEIKELHRTEPIGNYLLKHLKSFGYGQTRVVSGGEGRISKFIEIMKSENVDIVFDSMYAASILSKEAEMEPILIANRQGILYYSSYIFVRKESGINKIKDLKNKTIAFEDKGSTSAYFLPKRAIEKAGIPLSEKSSKAKLKYIFTHDKHQISNYVYLKKVDAGALSSVDWNEDNKVPLFMKDNLRIIHKTESIPKLFVMVRKGMKPELKAEIIKIFTNMHNSKEGRAAMEKYNLSKFHKIGFNWKEFFRIFD